MHVYNVTLDREYIPATLNTFDSTTGKRFKVGARTNQLISSFHYAVAQRDRPPGCRTGKAPSLGGAAAYTWRTPQQTDCIMATALQSCTGLFYLYPANLLFDGGQYSHVLGFHTSGGDINDFMNPAQATWPFNAYGFVDHCYLRYV